VSRNSLDLGKYGALPAGEYVPVAGLWQLVPRESKSPLQIGTQRYCSTEVYASEPPGTRLPEPWTFKHQVYANHLDVDETWIPTSCSIGVIRPNLLATRTSNRRLDLVRALLVYQSRRCPKAAVQGLLGWSAA